MKKLTLITLIILTSFIQNLNGQWITKTINNGIDAPYKIAYCENSTRIGVLKLEQTEQGIAFYLSGGYHCDENPTIDLAILVNNEPKRYNFLGIKSKDSRAIFIIDDMLSSDQSEFLQDFKKGSQITMRINESYCQSDYYKFNMTNSTKAIEFMSTELK